MALTIEEPGHYRIALLHLGFRPFFLLGSLFAIVAVAIWYALYHHGFTLPAASPFTPIRWHAHEMLYGYALAVVAGFLLTAVKNWTGIQTLHGAPLLLLVALWLGARLMPFLPLPSAPMIMAVLDLLFGLWLSLALLLPIYRARQWAQLGIWVKVLLLWASNGLFYLGLFGWLEAGERWGLYSGLYLIVSLVLLMGRRVIPFFIEKGVGYPVTLKNYRWLDLASLLLVLLFWFGDVFLQWQAAVAVVALALALLHGARLLLWHTAGIWRKPLLWSLYLAYGWIVVAFLLKALSGFGLLAPMAAVHAFAYGGIGLVTLGMMARVAYGHTGRDVFNPPRLLFEVFALLLAGSLVRVVLPLLLPAHYLQWIAAAQILWIAAFTLFFTLYARLLILPRVDGRYG